MKFLTIMPFTPSDVPFMAEEYKRMAKSANLSVMLPSMTLHPEGMNPYDKADFFIGAWADLKNRLDGSGIRLGVLLQALIGHGWSIKSPCGAGFQTTVNHTGGTRGRMCPLDEGFLQYCRYVVSSLAKLGPETFLLDDDTRLLDNNMLECFCPLHLAKFSRHYSQEELIRLVCAAKPGDAILNEFESVRRNSLEAFGRNIRAAIDSVNPAIPCGISGPGREQLMYERMALAAAGKTEPFIRVANAVGCEGSAKEFPRRIWHTAVQKKACGSVRTLLDEADTYPQNFYSKSSIGMHAHITAGILGGLTGAKLWISNFINPKAGRPNTEFERVLRENAGFYAELERVAGATRWNGPASPLPNLEKNFTPLEYSSYFTCAEWGCDVFGRLGIPYRCAEADDPSVGCFLMTGELAEHLTDAELKQAVEHHLLLDSFAALRLKKRGIELGIDLEPCPHFSFEEDTGSGEKMRFLYESRFQHPVPRGTAADEVYSVLKYIPFAGSSEVSERGAGCASGIMPNGKRAVVWTGVPEGCYVVSPERRRWFLRILRELENIPAACANEQDIFCRAGTLDGGTVVCALINLNYDPVTDVRLECAVRPSRLEALSSDGTWRVLEPRMERDGSISTGVSLGAYAPCVFRLVR